MSSYQTRNTRRAPQNDSPYDDQHVYVNIDIDSATGAASTENTTLATANVSKSIPIIMQSSHYHLIVDRFEIDGRMLPLYIFNPLETHTVRLRYLGIDYDVNLIHVNNQGLAPSDIGFYYYYTYQDMVDVINTALASAYALIPGNPAVAPFMTWESTSQRFRIYGAADFYNLAVVNPIEIMFNVPIYKLFPAYSYNNNGDGFYRLNMNDNFNNIFTATLAPGGAVPPYGAPPLPAAAPSNYIFLEDQFSVVDKWNPIDSIIFVSNKISLKETFASISNVNQNNTNAGTLAILTDFKLDAINSGDPRKSLIYNPSIYRKLDLYSSSPINTIDISVYFTDKETNQLNPIRVFEGDKISIKLLFEKKEIYK